MHIHFSLFISSTHIIMRILTFYLHIRAIFLFGAEAAAARKCNENLMIKINFNATYRLHGETSKFWDNN